MVGTPRHLAGRLLDLLGGIPQRIHLGQVAVLRPLAPCRQLRFDGVEPAGEFGVGAAQRGLRIDPEVPRRGWP